MKKFLVTALCTILLFGCGAAQNGLVPTDLPDYPQNESPAGIVASGVPPTLPHDYDLSEVNKSDFIEVKEKVFVALINDMYLNGEDYIGKTIKYEGIFNIHHDDVTQDDFFFVIRYGPGCCGTDGDVGFEVVPPSDVVMPEQNDWVEVVGVLEEFEEIGMKFLRLRLDSLKVLDVRGAETVF